MLSHRNVIFQMRNADAFIPLGTDDEQLAFLPLCHVAERTFTVFLPLRSGAIANFAESIETVPENVREVAPTTFFAVPRIWERFYSGIAIRMKEATWIGRMAYGWAIGIGLKVAEARARGPEALAAPEACSSASPTSSCSTTSSAPSACIACASPAPAPRRSRPT